MSRHAHKQLALPEAPTWGGKREGAGRKPTGQFGRDRRERRLAGLSHGPRPEIDARHPLHVTLRAVNGSPSLRNLAVAAEIGRLLKRRAQRELGCRVVHFSIQFDHVHIIVEADDRAALLRNGPKHGVTALAVDSRSSAAWFDGLAARRPARTDPAPVVAARTWLLATGLASARRGRDSPGRDARRARLTTGGYGRRVRAIIGWPSGGGAGEWRRDDTHRAAGARTSPGRPGGSKRTEGTPKGVAPPPETSVPQRGSPAGASWRGDESAS